MQWDEPKLSMCEKPIPKMCCNTDADCSVNATCSHDKSLPLASTNVSSHKIERYIADTILIFMGMALRVFTLITD